MKYRDTWLFLLLAKDISPLVRGWRCVVLFMIYGTVLGLAHYLYYSSAFDRYSTFDLKNEFGDLIEQLILAGRYQVCKEWPFPGWGFRCFVAHRLPAVPLFLAAIGKFSDSLLLASLIKNAVLFGFTGVAIAIATRDAQKVPLVAIIPVLIILLLPYNAFTAASLEFEEGYIFHLLPAAILAVVRMETRGDVLVAAVSLFFLVLTKSTLFVLSLALAAWGAYRAAIHLRSLTSAAVIVLSLFAACLSWGIFTAHATGKPAWGSEMSSWNGWHLYKANHPNLFTVYPRYSPDYLDLTQHSGAEDVSKDEWALQDYYRDRGLDLILSDPWKFLVGSMHKLFISLIEVRETAGTYEESRRFNVSMIFNRLLVLGLILLLFCRWTLRSDGIRATRQQRTDLAFILFLSVLYLAPYLVGFVYHRHVIPLLWAISLWSMSELLLSNRQ